MPRSVYTRKTQDKVISDVENGIGFSATTREKLTPYLTVPSQGSIMIQAIVGNKKTIMFSRGYDILNDAGVEGIDLDISLYQDCTSDTEDGNIDMFNLANTNDQPKLMIHTNPQNVVLGTYRGDLSNSIYTELKAVNRSVNVEKEYIMPTNEKDILLIENYNANNDIKIAFIWQFIER